MPNLKIQINLLKGRDNVKAQDPEHISAVQLQEGILVAIRKQWLFVD